MKRLKIVIVDDSPSICGALREELCVFPEFEVVKTMSNPAFAVEEIQKLRPDVLLLDAVMPSLDGDDVLEALKGTLDYNLGVIILSPINNDLTINHYSRLGAHYFVPKPVNTVKLIKKVRQLQEHLALESGTFISAPETVPDNRLLNAKITKILLKTGINPKLKGFCFLRESIGYICVSGNELSSVTKIVYPKIANDYETESEKVERAIRTAIEKAFTCEDGGSFYYEALSPGTGRKSSKSYPSNREFIFTVAENIKNFDSVDLIG